MKRKTTTSTVVETVPKNQKTTTTESACSFGELVFHWVIRYGVETSVFNLEECIMFRLVSRFIKTSLDSLTTKYCSTSLMLKDAIFLALNKRDMYPYKNEIVDIMFTETKFDLDRIFTSPFSNIVFLSSKSKKTKSLYYLDLGSRVEGRGIVHLLDLIQKNDSDYEYHRRKWSVQFNHYCNAWFICASVFPLGNLCSDSIYDGDLCSWVWFQDSKKLETFQSIKETLMKKCVTLLIPDFDFSSSTKYLPSDSETSNEFDFWQLCNHISDSGIQRWANNRYVHIHLNLKVTVVQDGKEVNCIAGFIDLSKSVFELSSHMMFLLSSEDLLGSEVGMTEWTKHFNYQDYLTPNGFFCFRQRWNNRLRLVNIEKPQNIISIPRIETKSGPKNANAFLFDVYSKDIELYVKVVESILPNGQIFVIVIRILHQTHRSLNESEVIIWDSFTEKEYPKRFYSSQRLGIPKYHTLDQFTSNHTIHIPNIESKKKNTETGCYLVIKNIDMEKKDITFDFITKNPSPLNVPLRREPNAPAIETRNKFTLIQTIEAFWKNRNFGFTAKGIFSIHRKHPTDQYHLCLCPYQEPPK